MICMINKKMFYHFTKCQAGRPEAYFYFVWSYEGMNTAMCFSIAAAIKIKNLLAN